MDKMSSVHSPALDLHGRDHFHTIIIALCIRSRCAICPAVTDIYKRPGRVCVMNAYLGALAGHVHAQQPIHGARDIPPSGEEPVLALV